MTSRLRLSLDRVQWRRGARAGIAVAMLMVVCHLFNKPTGWAALGVLQVLTVDNGGPYRSRLANILTVIIGGAIGMFLGTISADYFPAALITTALFCFTATLIRVVSQPLASGSVAIMIAYIIAFGGSNHTLEAALSGAGFLVIGGLWASCFSLVLWPVDPFKPARHAVANLYAKLTELAAVLPYIDATADRTELNDLVPQIRLLIEEAQSTLAATPARMTARTVRARNLAAMVQAADLLFARILRLAELSTHDPITEPEISRAHFTDLAGWLLSALRPVEQALRERPIDRGAAFSAEGSFNVDMHRRALWLEASLRTAPPSGLPLAISIQLDAQFAAVERDCLLSLEVVYESMLAIWTGAEPRATRAAALRSSFTAPGPPPAGPSSISLWLEAFRANLTPRSVMFRHALRVSAVTSVDVIILHLIHLNHGYWLPMTSVIVLQPYTGETWRRSGDRVAGTVAGAVLAAVLAATIPSQWGIITVISIGTFLTLAVFAVDYAWYCFFLTPTVVLLTLPHLRDWHFAAVRMGMTFLGATTAVIAMLIFWPERESIQLPRLLARAASADTAYLRAILKFWSTPTTDVHARTLAERSILAPARRACGMATGDAEESLDRSLLEHAIPLRSTPAHERLNHDALTFTTYLRRLTQGIGNLAVIGAESPTHTTPVTDLAARLDAISTTLTEHHEQALPIPEIALDQLPNPSLSDQQLIRMRRQITILERAAADISVATLT